MANVMEILGMIKTAIYGRDVRQSIYDAILQCYADATGNPESIAAHTGDTNNPHNVTAEQVGLANAEEDISQAQKDISGLKNPEFEDFTADGSTPPDARTAIAAITSKMSFFTYLSKVKAALMGLVTLGEMRSLLINNGLTTEAGKYFLDAAYGKTLADLVASNTSAISQLISDLLWKDVTDEFTFASDLTISSSNKKVYYNPATKRIVFNISGSGNTTLGTIRDIATFPSKYYPKAEIFGALYGFVNTSDSTYFYETRVYRSQNGIRIIPNVTKTGAQIRINISWICN